MVVTAVRPRQTLWRNRDFLLLWSGQAVSVLGSRVSATAVPLLVLAMTHSPATAGVVGFVSTLPHLLVQLPAGALVDRWNRWRVMVTCDLGRLLVVASLPIAWWLGGLTITQVAIVGFAETALLVFFELAEGAALPRLVSAGELPSALAQNEAKSRGAALAGQPLGGLLFGLDRGLPFVADTVSYAVSTVALLLMRRRDLADPDPAPREPLGREISAGVRWLVRQPFLRDSVLLVAGSNLIFQALTLCVIVLAGARGASPAMIGLLLGVWVGVVCSAPSPPRGCAAWSHPGSR